MENEKKETAERGRGIEGVTEKGRHTERERKEKREREGEKEIRRAC